MYIQPNKVESSIKHFMKKGALNVWQHQVVYFLPLVIFYPIIGIVGVLPKYATNVLMFFVGIFFLFLYMEITMTTTQEKYTPQKYLTSFVVAALTAMNFVKRHVRFIALLLFVGLTMDILTMYMSSTVVVKFNFMEKFLSSISNNAGTFVFVDIVAIAFVSREVASDYFVTQRLLGLKMETPNEITQMAISKNGDFLKVATYFVLFVSLFSVKMLGIQAIFFIILVAATTFYSMEVFDVDSGKKKRQEESEKEKSNIELMSPVA